MVANGSSLAYVKKRGDAFIASDKKRIELEMNPKEPELMDKLNKGLRILNTMDIRDPDGRSIQFYM